jgi:hypothetical protein
MIKSDFEAKLGAFTGLGLQKVRFALEATPNPPNFNHMASGSRKGPLPKQG